MEVVYAQLFLRQYKVLSESLKMEVKEVVRLFCDEKNHQRLHVHKLKGRLREQYSFRVNHRMRIIFWYTKSKPRTAILLTLGDHDVYNR